ncbi:16S rRNA (cytidine(1402)-2'-O)-methyltransferase [Paenibacillus sp. FSL W7-1287]|uniref:16S rRNA (cytidine(1402)-2'-O)-methyltransferase n=1 Tax=Paenibacillus sp. FSL W7-1287 TaxID=2954538 RepID=UPI0030F8E701
MNIQKSYQDERASGTLYLVATPIGNLEDITMRALRMLKEVDIIAAEDTRNTRKLLTHFDIKTRLVSYHEHNKEASGPELIKLLIEGKHIALVSDAGMPAISDPGADLARMAIEQEIAVVPIPGANAALSSLIVSGLSTDRFTFIGFLPRDKKATQQLLEQYKNYRESIIFYESPHRIKKTLEAMLDSWGDRQASISRELTKKHEEMLRGRFTELLAHFEEYQPLGEFCIVVEGLDEEGAEQLKQEANAWWQKMSIEEHVSYYEASMPRKAAMKQTALDRSISKRDVYNEINR